MALKRVRIDESENSYENPFLSASVKKLYLNAELADVYFVFGDRGNRERVPAHKNILAVGSDVFKAMSYGELKETGDVKITDTSSAAFKEFLQFFYRSKLTLTVENAFDVVNLCKKYDVAACLNICDKFLNDEITQRNDNVCSVYGLAIYFDLDDLMELCESKIVDDTKTVFGSASFLDCDRSVLSRIMKFDALSCSEVKVFEACMNWVKAKAQKEEVTKELVQAHLGELFYEIRFGSMTLGELADLTPSYGKLFSIDEYQDIVQMIRKEDFQSKLFKKEHRQSRVPPWNADAVIECERYVDGSTHFGFKTFKSVEKTTFTTNEPVLLGEIECEGIFDDENKYTPVEISICEISSNGASKVFYNKQNVLFSSSNHATQLSKPILIKPEFNYEIDIKNSSTKRVKYYSYWLWDKVQLTGSDIIIQFVGENKHRGVVGGLKFNLISEA